MVEGRQGHPEGWPAAKQEDPTMAKRNAKRYTGRFKFQVVLEVLSKQKDKYAAVGDLVFEIAREHPAYGYRKVVTELREEHKKVVNHKVVRRLQKDLGLMVLRTVRLPRPGTVRKVLVQMGNRINLIAGLETIAPFEVLHTDFTELLYDRGSRKAQLMPIVDHTGKLVMPSTATE